MRIVEVVNSSLNDFVVVFCFLLHFFHFSVVSFKNLTIYITSYIKMASLGFLLGRYATDRAILLKNAALQERQHTEEKFSHDIMNNLTSLMNDINRSISDAHITDFNLYLRKLNCTDASLTTHHNATHFDANMASNVINLKTTQFLNGHLRLLSACFTDIYTYLEELPHDPGNKDTVTSVKSD